MEKTLAGFLLVFCLISPSASAEKKHGLGGPHGGTARVVGNPSRTCTSPSKRGDELKSKLHLWTEESLRAENRNVELKLPEVQECSHYFFEVQFNKCLEEYMSTKDKPKRRDADGKEIDPYQSARKCFKNNAPGLWDSVFALLISPKA